MKSLDIHSLSIALIKGFLFLFPFYFLPITFDVVELNKSLLLLAFALILLAALAVKGIKEKEFKVTIGYLTIPLLILLGAFGLSAIFSISTSYSLWGIYGSLSNSFPVLAALVLLPILIASHIDGERDIKDLLVYLTGGLSVIFLHAVLNYFNVFSGLEETSMAFLSNPGFTVAGSLSVLKYGSVITAFLATYLLARKDKNYYKDSAALLALTLSLITGVLYFDAMIYLLILGGVALGLFLYRGFLNNKSLYLIGLGVMVSLAVLFASMNPSMAEPMQLQKELPSTNGIDYRTSWSVANSVVGSRPLFGSGIGTFVSDYAQFKPRYINNTDFWDTRFVKPYSFYLLILSEVGLIGLLALLFVIIRLGLHSFDPKSKLLFDKEDESTQVLSDLSALKTSALILAVLLLFTSGNAFLLGLFFSILGLVLALEKINNTGKAYHRKLGIVISGSEGDANREVSSLTIGGYTVVHLYKVISVLAIVSILLGGFFTYRVFASDAAYRSLLSTPETLLDVRNNYRTAASIHPAEDFYQRSVININQTIARVISEQNQNPEQELTEEQMQNNVNDVTTLLNESVVRADFITSDTDLGVNPVNWETKGLLYQSLIGSVEGADVNAVQSYNVASGIEPLNPRIIASIGTVYYSTEDYERARDFFERAVILKPDYAAARYNLAKALEQLERNIEAYQVANTLLGIIPEDSEDYETAREYVASLEEKARADAEQLQQQQQQQQLELQTDEGSTVQPPLTEPSEPPTSAPEETNQSLPEEPTENPEEEEETVEEEEDTEEESSDEDSASLPGQEFNEEGESGFVEENQE